MACLVPLSYNKSSSENDKPIGFLVSSVRVFETWESVRVLTAGAAERTPGTWLSRDPDLREITRVIPTLEEQ